MLDAATWWSVSVYLKDPSPVEVIAESKHYVTVPAGQHCGEHRAAKADKYGCIFETFAEAKSWLVDFARASITSKTLSMQEQCERLVELEALQEPEG